MHIIQNFQVNNRQGVIINTPSFNNLNNIIMYIINTHLVSHIIPHPRVITLNNAVLNPENYNFHENKNSKPTIQD